MTFSNDEESTHRVNDVDMVIDKPAHGSPFHSTQMIGEQPAKISTAYHLKTDYTEASAAYDAGRLPRQAHGRELHGLHSRRPRSTARPGPARSFDESDATPLLRSQYVNLRVNRGRESQEDQRQLRLLQHVDRCMMALHGRAALAAG